MYPYLKDLNSSYGKLRTFTVMEGSTGETGVCVSRRRSQRRTSRSKVLGRDVRDLSPVKNLSVGDSLVRLVRQPFQTLSNRPTGETGLGKHTGHCVLLSYYERCRRETGKVSVVNNTNKVPDNITSVTSTSSSPTRRRIRSRGRVDTGKGDVRQEDDVSCKL